MAEMAAAALPLSWNFRQLHLATSPPCGASDLDTWPLTSSVDYVATTGLQARNLLRTISYGTKTMVDLVSISNGRAGE